MKRDLMMVIRVTPDERRAAQVLADSYGVSVSRIIRVLVDRDILRRGLLDRLINSQEGNVI